MNAVYPHFDHLVTITSRYLLKRIARLTTFIVLLRPETGQDKILGATVRIK